MLLMYDLLMLLGEDLNNINFRMNFDEESVSTEKYENEKMAAMMMMYDVPKASSQNLSEESPMETTFLENS